MYGYKALFGDVFNDDRYAVTPTKFYRTGLVMFENSGHEDLRDEVPVDVESSGSSDEPDVLDRAAAGSMDVSDSYNRDKWKVDIGKNKGK